MKFMPSGISEVCTFGASLRLEGEGEKAFSSTFGEFQFLGRGEHCSSALQTQACVCSEVRRKKGAPHPSSTTPPSPKGKAYHTPTSYLFLLPSPILAFPFGEGGPLAVDEVFLHFAFCILHLQGGAVFLGAFTLFVLSVFLF